MGIRFPIQKKSVENWLESVRAANGISRVVFRIFSSENPVEIRSNNSHWQRDNHDTEEHIHEPNGLSNPSNGH